MLSHRFGIPCRAGALLPMTPIETRKDGDTRETWPVPHPPILPDTKDAALVPGRHRSGSVAVIFLHSSR